MYYGARYYDPALSRFITADTIYDRGPQGLNRYSYALNNPVRYNDPSGHLSYADDQSEDTWTEPLTITQAPSGVRDIGDGMTVKTVELYNDGAELKPGPRFNLLRRNFITRSLGDTLMVAEDILSGGRSSWSGCNRITRECYTPKDLLEAKMNVLTDVATSAAGAAISSASKAPKRAFAHGTSLEHIDNIMKNGFDEAMAKTASKGGKLNRPGSFHTVELSSSEHLQTAYEFGFRHSSSPAVFVTEISESTYQELLEQSAIRIRSLDESRGLMETIFDPDSYKTLNNAAEFKIIDPYGRR